MKLMFLGPPGAGKGTQAERICAKYKISHISTGDILRSEHKAGTPLGKRVQHYIDSGALVPDELIIEIVKHRLTNIDCTGGFLLDGFPRTVFQAQALAKIVELDAVFNLDVPFERLFDRATGRRVCTVCGATYHVSSLQTPTICPKCDGALIQREDDKHETVMNRLKVYEAQTKPLIEYYLSRGKLITIDGDRSIDAVTAAIFDGTERLV